MFENDSFVCLVPFWAVWPFETMLAPQARGFKLRANREERGDALAAAFSEMTIRYDSLFETSFAYSMGFHQQPTYNSAHPEWALHAPFHPPLWRSASVEKFIVGFEMLGTTQRDIAPEGAVERLSAMPAAHYLNR